MKKITKKTLLEQGACSESLPFLNKCKNAREAWEKCPRAEWMIWALSQNGLWDETIARKFAIIRAKHTLHFFEEKYPDDKRPRLAIKAAQDFLDGKIDETARSAAESAARSAAWSAARSAAESAAGSAARSAAESAAWRAAWSAARSAAESAAGSAAWSAAEKEAQWQADKLRKLMRCPKEVE